ncbi:hypothetical protein JNM05_14315 [bacterium]|nr:hypothetical protein [bacterium]
MKKIILILTCGFVFSCGNEKKEKTYEVNITENKVYLVFSDQDTIKLDVLSYYEETDSLFPFINNAFIRAQSDSQFLRLNFPLGGAVETLFIGEFLKGDTLQPDVALFVLGIGMVVENSDQKLKAISQDTEFLDYFNSSDLKYADVFVHISK